ncbi:MAG: hypothetical protein H8E38_04530 [SAR324 cluster bacterium]|nr:hypothetical protein [SAR324 cluster bacterium]MBL7035616.1 hypothetical protein [SAR324 cluster bacterium]
MSKTILAIKANLFPDGQTVEAALREMETNHEVRFETVIPETMDDQAWDKILSQILSVDKVITI